MIGNIDISLIDNKFNILVDMIKLAYHSEMHVIHKQVVRFNELRSLTQQLFPCLPAHYHFFYIDQDGDQITLNCQTDIYNVTQYHQSCSQNSLKLTIVPVEESLHQKQTSKAHYQQILFEKSISNNSSFEQLLLEGLNDQSSSEQFSVINVDSQSSSEYQRISDQEEHEEDEEHEVHEEDEEDEEDLMMSLSISAVEDINQEDEVAEGEVENYLEGVQLAIIETYIQSQLHRIVKQNAKAYQNHLKQVEEKGEEEGEGEGGIDRMVEAKVRQMMPQLMEELFCQTKKQLVLQLRSIKCCCCLNEEVMV